MKLYLNIALTMAVLTSCSWLNDPNDEHKSSLPKLESFAIIPATGKSITLGKADSPIAELTPAVQVTFDYDFYLAKTEFTVDEYNKLMNKSLGGETLNPLNNVNWFEAILIANAKSKSENLDTVYSYQSISIGVDGHVTNISNLKSHFEIDGYRLPTEAEWSLAASWENSNQYPFNDVLENANDHGWFYNNSQNTVHKVKEKEPNSLGIFDMAGNLMEWNSDWKGQFPNQPITNFVGQLDGNPINEKVLKGGHFGSSPTPWYTRSDTYTFSTTSTSPYIGFRLARGKILNSNYSTKGNLLSENIGTFANPPSMIKKFFKNRIAKLVYVDHLSNSLIYANINGINSVIRSIDTKGLPVYHPVISPNGEWVAFSTVPEGVNGASSIYLKNLVNPYQDPILISNTGAIPRWHLDSLGKTSLIYNSDAQSNQDFLTWSNKKMYKQVLTFSLNHINLGELAELKVPGTFNGGFSQDLTFWSTGYTKLYNYETQNPTPKLLFTSPQNGKNNDGSSQVCNVSVSPNNDKEILFIDFGYSENSTIIGKPYKIHEYLFKANSDGKLIQWYRAPDGYANWNFPEWSNHADFAVSSVVDKQENPSSLWAINLRDSTYFPLIEGQNLRMPYLWIGDVVESSIDDKTLMAAIQEGTGQYRIPLSNEVIRYAAVKMNRFWNHYQSIEYAVVGSSHALGIYPALYQNQYYGINLSWPAQGFISTKALLTEYLNRAPNLKTVFLSADFTWWRDSENRFAITLGESLGFSQDKKNNFWPQNTDLIQAASNYEMNQISYLPDVIDIHGGIQETATSSWGEATVSDDSRWTWDDAISKKLWANFVDLVDTLTNKGINVILVEYPQNPDYKNTEYHGLYGPLKTTWSEIENSIELLKSKNSLFHYIDLNDEGNHSFLSIHALNHDHLNHEGGKKATKILIDSMKVWSP